MPRVVPSQIVKQIAEDFPSVIDSPDRNVLVDNTHAGLLRGLVTLLRELPPELLTLSAEDYASFVSAVGALEYTMERWLHRDEGGGLKKVKGRTPLFVIYDVLRKCPDEAPAPSTVALSFIADNDLRESIRRDISAANQDLVNGEFKGATVLAGAAVEALLLWALTARKPAVDVTRGVDQAMKGGCLAKRPSSDPEDWGLHEYIAVAAELQLIGESTAIQARQAKNYRNLIHPGRALRLGEVCDRGTALAALSAVELVVRDLS